MVNESSIVLSDGQSISLNPSSSIVHMEPTFAHWSLFFFMFLPILSRGKLFPAAGE